MHPWSKISTNLSSFHLLLLFCPPLPCSLSTRRAPSVEARQIVTASARACALARAGARSHDRACALQGMQRATRWPTSMGACTAFQSCFAKSNFTACLPFLTFDPHLWPNLAPWIEYFCSAAHVHAIVVVTNMKGTKPRHPVLKENFLTFLRRDSWGEYYLTHRGVRVSASNNY